MSDLEVRLHKLKLNGLLEHLEDVRDEPWLEQMVQWEEESRHRRSLERRLKRARLGHFKAMADFDWAWPENIDRAHVEDLFRLQWVSSATNVVLIGPNGVGKTMIARNLAHQAILAGHTVKVMTASEMLNSLAEIDSSSMLTRRLRALVRPQILVVDELGYLSYGNRHADLLFEVISRRYEHKPILITTNKVFSDWASVFSSASSVTTIVDRLVHRCEVVPIKAESYRLKEHREDEAEARRARLQDDGPGDDE